MKKLLVVAGPTASGKSALASALGQYAANGTVSGSNSRVEVWIDTNGSGGDGATALSPPAVTTICSPGREATR